MSATVIIVGGGLAGLSASVELSSLGCRVILVERNAHLGGKMNLLSEKGFTFDMGPTILTLPQVLRGIIRRSGRRVEDYIDLINLVPQWRCHYEDKTVIDLLGDLGKSNTVEGRVILGAAVIDDVLGLVVLAVVTGLIEAADAGRAFDPLGLAAIVGKAIGFLVAAVIVGRLLSKVTFRFAARLPGEGLLLSFGLAFCFLFAWVAGLAGLAPIVGAFAAGLVLDDVHYLELRQRDAQKRDLHHLLEPIASFLVPVFFVLMGMSVELTAFARTDVLAFAGVLSLAAIVGKQICSLGVLDKGADRLAVGLGMIPRGEVGLIFASIGRTLHIGGERVIDDMVYSAIVVMVAVTTLVTPPLLVWRLKRPTRS